MIWLLLGIGLFLILLHIYMVKPFQHWKRMGVPQYSVITIYKDLLLGFFPFRPATEPIQNAYNDFSDKRCIGSYIFGKPGLFLRDPEIIKQVTIKDFEYFMDHYNPMSKNKDKIMHRNLLILQGSFNFGDLRSMSKLKQIFLGEAWKNMRMILSPSFTSSKLKTIYSLIADCAKQFINHFNKMEDKVVTLEMKSIFSKFTNDVIATSAFGISCNSIENSNNDFYVMGKELTNFNNILTNLRMMTIFIFPKVAQILGLQVFKKKLTDFFENLITQNIEAREKHGIVRPDMIQLLLEARKKGDGLEEIVEEESEIYSVIKDNKLKSKKIKLTDEDIMSQAFIFFLAGFETISTALSFMSYELAINPDVQEKLYEEIEENSRNFGNEPTYENLMKMKYLDMVISESLRKYPPAIVSDRMCVKPYTIQPLNKDESPIYVKVGDLIWIPTYAIHRDPKYFTNPDRFDPERFSEENKSKIIPGTYLPFGIGPRHCIGNRFALMEIKLVLYYILSNFKFVVVPKTQIPLKFAPRQLAFNAEKGFWLGLEKRN